MKTRPLQVGITGGIGAGKSVVCKIFKALGAPTYDADYQAKYLMTHASPLRQKILANFGAESYLKSGDLNRTYLAAHVFGNPERVALLNQLVHPEVGKHYAQWIVEQGHQIAYTIKEAALMIESGSYVSLDYLINVVAPVNLRITRVMQRDPQRNNRQIQEILASQLTDSQRNEKSDFIVQNDQEHMVIPQVLDLHQKFIGLAD